MTNLICLITLKLAWNCWSNINTKLWWFICLPKIKCCEDNYSG